MTRRGGAYTCPFNVSFRGREDRMISEKLKAEAPGILHLMIQACLEWQRVGLSPPQSVTDATTGLFRDLDPLGRFMDECLESDANAFSSTAELVKAYANFLLSNGEDQYVEQKTLILQIRERGGYTAGVTRNAQGLQMRGVRGVKIKDPLLQV